MAEASAEVDAIGPFVLGRTLGVGSTGKVKLGVHKETGQTVAIKIVRKETFNTKPSLRRKVEREIAVMKLLDHPSVLRMFDVLETENSLYLVLEHVEGGELFDYLVKKGRLSPEEALGFFQQIVLGVDYCHRHLICHRDLKPENVLLDKDMHIKIADFGMASLMPEGVLLETSCGSPHYASPEVVMGTKYDGNTADVWSCGVILYALLTGRLPFDDDKIQRLLTKVKSGVFTMPQFLPPDAKDLIWKMLTVDPASRITMEEVKAHPFFNTIPCTSDGQEYTSSHMAKEPILQIDPEILGVLRTLGWGDEIELVETLRSSDEAIEKVYYKLLEKRKQSPEIAIMTETTVNVEECGESMDTQPTFVIEAVDANVLNAERIQLRQEPEPDNSRATKRSWFTNILEKVGLRKDNEDEDASNAQPNLVNYISGTVVNSNNPLEVGGHLQRVLNKLNINFDWQNDCVLDFVMKEDEQTAVHILVDAVVAEDNSGILLRFFHVNGPLSLFQSAAQIVCQEVATN